MTNKDSSFEQFCCEEVQRNGIAGEWKCDHDVCVRVYVCLCMQCEKLQHVYNVIDLVCIYREK